MANLTRELSDWLDLNNAEDYKKVVIVPDDATEDERIELLSASVLGMSRRRELVNNLITAANLELNSESIQEALRIIKEWQIQKG